MRRDTKKEAEARLSCRIGDLERERTIVDHYFWPESGNATNKYKLLIEMRKKEFMGRSFFACDLTTWLQEQVPITEAHTQEWGGSEIHDLSSLQILLNLGTGTELSSNFSETSLTGTELKELTEVPADPWGTSNWGTLIFDLSLGTSLSLRRDICTFGGGS